MKYWLIYLFTFLFFTNCNHSKWITIKGTGISDEPKSIDNAIYFENENIGVVGGYKLVDDITAENDFKLSEIPLLFLTENGGKNWSMIHFDSTLKGSIRNCYLHLDTLICLDIFQKRLQYDSVLLFSTNKGITFEKLEDSVQRQLSVANCLKNTKATIIDDKFEKDEIKYSIKEFYKNDVASIIICYGPESLTDYYFVSFDNGATWSLLQKDFSDNREKFLLGDKLYRYYFPFGLQRLSLRS